MNKKLSAIFFVLLACTPRFASAESLKNIAEIRQLTEQAMEIVKKNDFEGSVDVLEKYSSISKPKIDELRSQLKAQAPVVFGNYGEVIGIEFLKQEEIGKTLIKITYLSRHDVYALKWEFIFYNGKEGWKLVQYSFNDKIADLF